MFNRKKRSYILKIKIHQRFPWKSWIIAHPLKEMCTTRQKLTFKQIGNNKMC